MNWKPLLCYVLKFHVLVRGWLTFTLLSKDNCEEVLNKNWSWGLSGLVLHKWMVDFDVEREPINTMKLWDILPSLTIGLLDQGIHGSHQRKTGLR